MTKKELIKKCQELHDSRDGWCHAYSELNELYETLKMKTHQTFRLDDKIIKAVQNYAEKENRTISNVYETAVIEYLKARGQKIKKPSTK